MDSRSVDPLTVLDPSIALDGSLAALAITALLCGLAALALARGRPARLHAEQLEVRPALRGSLEPVLAGLVLVWGLALAFRIQAASNPQGLPLANDLHEYLGFVLHWIDPELGYLPPYRYPLWAWLAARISTGLGMSPVNAAMALSTISAGLMPLALYALARQLAPPGVAMAGAVLACATPAFVQQVGVPNDYMLGALLGVLALAASLGAVLRGGWPRHLAAGLALALLMASSYRAFTSLGLMLIVLIAAAGWRSWTERRPLRALELLAVLVPMAMLWWLYGEHCRAVSLERAVYTVHEHMAAFRHEHIGWQDYPRSGAALAQTGGTWVVGHRGALRGLPTTVAFLLDASELGARLGKSWQDLLPYLRHALGLRWLPWALLALPASLAVGAWSGPRPPTGARMLAATLVLGALAVSILPLRSAGADPAALPGHLRCRRPVAPLPAPFRSGAPAGPAGGAAGPGPGLARRRGAPGKGHRRRPPGRALSAAGSPGPLHRGRPARRAESGRSGQAGGSGGGPESPQPGGALPAGARRPARPPPQQPAGRRLAQGAAPSSHGEALAVRRLLRPHAQRHAARPRRPGRGAGRRSTLPTPGTMHHRGSAPRRTLALPLQPRRAPHGEARSSPVTGRDKLAAAL